ncbi:YraN family protein [Rubrolithibacter danxiaensis]|uniref:YraN family protein n=1 Tax=Rubrolithibacter danxiaensis TaxID=3390805 RepID=UPI003BF91E5A
MAVHNQLGKRGEIAAKEFLENGDYEILDENWCFGKAEVDLIAYKDKKIVFVEVKTRTSVTFGNPEDFVEETKQDNVRKAAEEYIYLMNFQGEIRFDIISVLFNKEGKFTLKHIEDAFW